jgi:hypothetical protein
MGAETLTVELPLVEKIADWVALTGAVAGVQLASVL